MVAWDAIWELLQFKKFVDNHTDFDFRSRRKRIRLMGFVGRSVQFTWDKGNVQGVYNKDRPVIHNMLTGRE